MKKNKRMDKLSQEPKGSKNRHDESTSIPKTSKLKTQKPLFKVFTKMESCPKNPKAQKLGTMKMHLLSKSSKPKTSKTPILIFHKNFP